MSRRMQAFLCRKDNVFISATGLLAGGKGGGRRSRPAVRKEGWGSEKLLRWGPNQLWAVLMFSDAFEQSV
jgi:hypothetical protein